MCDSSPVSQPKCASRSTHHWLELTRDGRDTSDDTAARSAALSWEGVAVGESRIGADLDTEQRPLLLTRGHDALAPRDRPYRQRLRGFASVALSSGYALSLAVHLVWGLHPVFGRYLQVQSPTPMDGLVLSCSGNVLSGLLMWAAEALHTALCQPFAAVDNNIPRAPATQQPPGVREWGQRAWCFAALFGGVTTGRVVLNVLSLNYTSAYNTQLVQCLAPVLTALADRVVLRTALPRTLWPALLLMLLGMALVALGQSPLLNPSNASLSWMDALGAGMQLGSVVFSAAARLCMSMTKDIIRKTHLVQVQNISNGVLLLAVSLAVRPQSWLVFGHLVPSSWAAFLGIVVLVWCLGKYYQITVIHQIGPGMHASLQSLRVLVAVAGSAWLLGEPVSSGWAWAGLVLTSATLTGWLFHAVGLKEAEKHAR